VSAGALVVGEALIDAVVDSGGTRRHPGGSPANVALGLARLGVDTRLHTAIGDDGDGRLIRDHLGNSGVTLTAESVTDGPTSQAVATLAEDGSATYQFALNWNPRDIDELEAPTVIHTGSLGAFLEPGCRVTSEILSRGRAAGALITFDPNIRPDLVGDVREARRRFGELASASHVTKLSDVDAEFLFPGTPLDDVLDLLIDGGVAVAGITRGSDGAYLASEEGRVIIPPAKTTVADTVGAGDSFMATLIWSLVFVGDGWNGIPVSERELDEVGRRAALAAAITVSRAGADLPYLSELMGNRRGEEGESHVRR
jgi:fructokinase